jgi:hypothetical protein
VSRDELIEVVRRIVSVDGTEQELNELMDLLERNVPHPEVSNLIFYPPDGISLSPEQVVDRALAYRPIELGSSGRGENL